MGLLKVYPTKLIFIMLGCMSVYTVLIHVLYLNRIIRYIVLIVYLAVLVYVFMKYIPFMYEGKDFIVNSLVISVVLVVVEIIMEYILVYTIAETTADLPNQRDTVLMKFGWIGSVLCRGFIYCIVLVGLAKWIVIAYQVAQFGFMVFCIDRMFRCRHYLKKQEIDN